MVKTTEALLKAGLAGRVLSISDLRRVLAGTPSSRYALVNKALKKEELIQLKRGVFILNDKYSSKRLSTFHVACQMEPHSYISLESALSYHGWIPEKVTVISSVINHGRTKSFETPLGQFHYHFIPTQPYEFLTGVSRESIEGQPFLIASPLRALMDYVYEKKLDWDGLGFLTQSLRIDIQQLIQLDQKDFSEIKRVYRSKRIIRYLEKLQGILDDYQAFNNSR